MRGVPGGRPPGLALITAITVPTGTVWSASTLISASVPLTGAGMSVSALAVPISARGSPPAPWAPTALCQALTVPSSTVSPILGMTTSTVRLPPSRALAGFGRRVLGVTVHVSCHPPSVPPRPAAVVPHVGEGEIGVRLRPGLRLFRRQVHRRFRLGVDPVEHLFVHAAGDEHAAV